jgi:spoIIIJ-associated protein
LRERIEPKLREFLDTVIREGEFRLSYRLTQPPPGAQRDYENPEIIVDWDGPDSELLLAQGGELLRSFEHLAHEVLRLGGDEHEKIVFDCQNRRMLRVDELSLAAQLAAERVQRTGVAYEFGPMNSRERRIIHMALRGVQGIKTQSEGVGPRRHVVIQSLHPAKPASAREIRRL